MDDETIEILSDAIKEYYGNYELEELCNRFKIEIEFLGNNPNHKKLVTNLVTQKYDDNCRRFLGTILPKLMRRCEERILNTTWEVNVFDEHMLPQLKKLDHLLSGSPIPVAHSKSTNRFFTTKTDLIKFFGTAETSVTIVDARVGKKTLDCLQGLRTQVNLLTGQDQQDFMADFGRYVPEFRSKGHAIEIRRHLKLNDHVFIFNGRCWLTSCSLTDVGQVTLSIIECMDTKSAVVKEIGRKWRESKVYLA